MKYISIKKVAASSAAGLGGALLLTLPASASVQTSDIANGAVTNAKIATSAITSSKIATNAVGSSEIATNAVGSSEIAAGAVGKSELGNSVTLGDASATDGAFTTDISRATGATAGSQPMAADLTLAGATAAGTSFNGAIMGHIHGSSLTGNSYHAGVIGGYSVDTGDTSTYPKAGVVGFVGADGPTTVGDAGVMSVIEGDGGVVTATAAYGVQYLNSTPNSGFKYGVDLKHAAAGYAVVSFLQGDIRLASGAAIASASGAPSSSGAAANTCNLGAGKDNWTRGSLYLRTDSATALYVCTATDTWSAVSFGA